MLRRISDALIRVFVSAGDRDALAVPARRAARTDPLTALKDG